MIFRTIRYMKKADIRFDGVSMSDEARATIQYELSNSSLVLRLAINDSQKVHIEFAAPISIENIRRACNLCDGNCTKDDEVKNG